VRWGWLYHIEIVDRAKGLPKWQSTCLYNTQCE
jgi:hypothetical protein